MTIVRWFRALLDRPQVVKAEVWLVDRDGRVYRPVRRVVLRARSA